MRLELHTHTKHIMVGELHTQDILSQDSLKNEIPIPYLLMLLSNLTLLRNKNIISFIENI